MATIGAALTSPESGWKRYDNTHPTIKYVGDFSFVQTGAQFYNGSEIDTPNGSQTAIGSKYIIRFSGRKLRCIATVYSGSSSSITVNVNGTFLENTAQNQVAGPIRQALFYEKDFGTVGDYTVEFVNNTTNYLGLDAVDIETTSRLLHPDEVTTLSNFTAVGQRIRCHYTATANSVGTLSNLGSETYANGNTDFITTSSTTTPTGDFYFILTDTADGKVAIADRNIQMGLSWDNLNTAGIANTGLQMSLGGSNVVIRLLTGGAAAGETSSEWYNYIVSSTLGGKITAGADSTWHWSGVYSWTSSDNNQGAGYKTIRGNTAANGSSYALSSATTSANSGYRPVLYIPNILTKYLVRDGTSMKYYNGTSWTDAGTYPPDSAMFSNYGMDDVSSLTYTNLSLLSSPQLFRWDSSDRGTTPSVSLTAIPKPVFTSANNDLSLSDVANIDSFTLTATMSGSGIVKVLVSSDSGSTWKTYDSGTDSWTVVDTSDTNNIKTSGLSITDFNAVPSSAWNQLLSASPIIRFGYYLEITSTSDVANTDSLSSQFDMKGIWKKAYIQTDYDYEYTSNTTLRVKIYTSGGYKINYKN